MSWVKAVPVDKRNWWHTPPALTNGSQKKNKDMKTLIRFALAAILMASTVVTQAGPVRGYFRSNGTYVAPHYRSDYGALGSTSSYGYVYRNPYAAYPSVHVRGYYRSSGTYVSPHVRTAPNNTVTDNLSYRGYGTIRVPRYSYGR